MKISSYESFAHIPDPNTESLLLPLVLKDSSNSAEFYYSKLALNTAIQMSLSDEQQIIIHKFYWEGKSKTQIAKEYGVVHSTIVKKIKIAESILKQQVEFAIKLYRVQKSDDYLS